MCINGILRFSDSGLRGVQGGGGGRDSRGRVGGGWVEGGWRVDGGSGLGIVEGGREGGVRDGVLLYI